MNHRHFASAIICCLLFYLASAAQQSAPTPTPKADSVLRGRVSYAGTGQPVRRARISAKRNDYGDGEISSTVSDNEGQYVLRGVQAGNYYVTADVPGEMSSFYAQTLSNAQAAAQGESDTPATQYVMPDGSNEITLNISLTPGSVITGRVSYDDGEPVVGFSVCIWRKMGKDFFLAPPGLAAVTDDRGQYRLEGAPAGEYLVGLKENTERRSDAAVVAYHPATRQRSEAMLVNVAGGSPTPNVNITVATNLRRVAGVVKIPAGKKFSKAEVQVWRKKEWPAATQNKEPEEDPERFRISYRLPYSFYGNDYEGDKAGQAEATADGRWEVRDLPPGEYFVTAKATLAPEPTPEVKKSEDEPENEEAREEVLLFQRKEVSLREGDIDGLVLEMGNSGALSGIVRDAETGQPLASITVHAYSFSDDEEEGYGYSDYSNYPNETSRQDGSFTLTNLKPGTYWLYVAESSLMGKSYYKRSITLGGVEVKEGVRVAPAAQVTGVVVQMSAEVAVVRVKVSNYQQSDRICYAPVTNKPDAPDWSCRSYNPGNSNEFSFEVAPGPYLVTALPRSPGAAKSYRELIIKALQNAVRVTAAKGPNEVIEITVPEK